MPKLLLHPGGFESPICLDCESNYQIDALGGRLVEVSAPIIIAMTDETRITIDQMMGTLKLKQTGVPNGLITNGPFQGFFARKVGKLFLLGRPASSVWMSTQVDMNFPYIRNIGMWNAVKEYMKGEPSSDFKWIDRRESGDIQGLSIHEIISERRVAA